MSTAALSFRHNAAVTVAAVVTMIAMLSLATWAPYLLVFMIIPLALAVWGWRTGTDADDAGLIVSAALGRRRIPWSQVSGFTATGRRVSAQLTGGTSIRLPAVPPTDLPRLVAISGAELVTQQPERPGTGGPLSDPRS